MKHPDCYDVNFVVAGGTKVFFIKITSTAVSGDTIDIMA